MDPAEALAVLQRALQPPPSPTVRVLWERWADVHRHTLEDFTTELGRWRHLEAFFADRQAAELTIFDVDGDKGYRQRRRFKLRGGAPLKPATRNREVTLLQRILNFAVEQGLLAKNPIAHAKPEDEANIQHSKVETEQKLKALTKEARPGELSRMPRDLLATVILCWYETGARRMEILEMCWDQFEGPWLIFPRTKNHDPRRVLMTPRALRAVEALPRYENCRYVFANPETRRPYCDRYIATLFARAVEASGLEGVNGENITPHKLRHGFAYRAQRFMKLPPRTVQKMMGQKTDSAARRYGITDEAETEEGWNVVALAGEIHNSIDRRGPKRALSIVPTDESQSSHRSRT